jgi:two-component system chemotaxis sensor kinase CheA/two-component system sensor histidine kinase and response regulator WspE
VSDRRQALFGRYKARALDRIRKLSGALTELEEGRGDDGLAKEVARELHTLKGDSTVVGQSRVSEVAHAAESLLLAAQTSNVATAGARACAEVRQALEVIAKCLQGELGDAGAVDAALVAARARLGGAAPKEGETERPSGLADEDVKAVSVEPDHTPATRAKPEPAEPRQAEAVSSAAAESATTGPEPEAEPVAAPQPEAGNERWVQINSARIDHLCEHVSEFASEFRSLAFELSRQDDEGTARVGRALLEKLDRCRTQIEDVIGSAWSLRLVPVEPALEELVRHARELARQQGKRVRIYVRGEGAEVERSVLDELWEPLLHLVRNAVDHGIETPGERRGKSPEANLVVQARQSGPNLVITVADDGRGVDVKQIRAVAVSQGLINQETADALPERAVLDLLFRHGFTTKKSVSEVSGRGVGLDIVREKVDALGGSVIVSSTFGQGTRFELTVPATIGKERALVIECGGALYGIPSGQVIEVVTIADSVVDGVAGGKVLRFRDESIPLRSLAGVVAAEDPGGEAWALVIEHASRRWAFGIQRLVGEYDLLRRPVDGLLAHFQHIAASAALDDGRLVLLLSMSGLLRRTEAGVAVRSAAAVPNRARKRVLVVDDSPTVREVVSEILADGGLEVKVAADGRIAWQMLEEELPDLVMTDLEMPVMDGFELLQRIRARWKHLPVVMLTTRGSAEDRRQATALGADAYLVKSTFEEATLMDTVRRFFGTAV